MRSKHLWEDHFLPPLPTSHLGARQSIEWQVCVLHARITTSERPALKLHDRSAPPRIYGVSGRRQLMAESSART